MKNLFLIPLLAILISNIPSLQANVMPKDTPFGVFFSPESLVQKQLKAYNERDIEAFLSCFKDDVKVYMFPDQILYKGKEKLQEAYGSFFQNTPDLYGELVDRSVNGNKVKDELLITRMKRTKPTKTTIMYVVEDGLIAKMYFIN